MVPYQDISEASGFPDGFRYRGYDWAADLTAVSIGKRTSGSAIEEIQLESTHHTSFSIDWRIGRPPSLRPRDNNGATKAQLYYGNGWRTTPFFCRGRRKTKSH